MTTAEQIRAIRARTGLSQEAFARVYEIPKRTVENWEAGTRCPPPTLSNCWISRSRRCRRKN